MKDIIDILKQVGAILVDDHFVLTSGKHATIYINKDALYPHTKEVANVGKMFAEKNKNLKVDVVVGPALGGIILSQWTAYFLSKLKKKEIVGIYTEKNAENDQIFRRGYDSFVKGKNVLVVEDLTATGGSVKKVVKSVRAAGGKVVKVCVMVNRDPKNINFVTIGAPFSSLGVFPAKAYEVQDCPACKNNIPFNTTVGHAKKYLELRKKK